MEEIVPVVKMIEHIHAYVCRLGLFATKQSIITSTLVNMRMQINTYQIRVPRTETCWYCCNLSGGVALIV